MNWLPVLWLAIGVAGCVYHDDYGYRDRDRGVVYGALDPDGIPNRADRDRDGVPDRQDRRPNDPTRY